MASVRVTLRGDGFKSGRLLIARSLHFCTLASQTADTPNDFERRISAKKKVIRRSLKNAMASFCISLSLEKEMLTNKTIVRVV